METIQFVYHFHLELMFRTGVHILCMESIARSFQTFRLEELLPYNADYENRRH